MKHHGPFRFQSELARQPADELGSVSHDQSNQLRNFVYVFFRERRPRWKTKRSLGQPLRFRQRAATLWIKVSIGFEPMAPGKEISPRKYVFGAQNANQVISTDSG